MGTSSPILPTTDAVTTRGGILPSSVSPAILIKVLVDVQASFASCETPIKSGGIKLSHIAVTLIAIYAGAKSTGGDITCMGTATAEASSLFSLLFNDGLPHYRYNNDISVSIPTINHSVWQIW